MNTGKSLLLGNRIAVTFEEENKDYKGPWGLGFLECC